MSSVRTKISRYRNLLIFSAVIIIALIAIILGNRNRPVTLPADSIEKVQTRTVEQIVSVDGNLAGFDEKDIFGSTQAKVTEVNVVVGQRVESGMRLARTEQVSGLTTKTSDITTNIGGTVTAVNYRVDDVITNPALPLFHVVNNGSYVISLNVNENDIANLKLDQPAKIVISAISLDTKIDGKVTFIAPASTSTTGTVNYLVKVTPDSVPAGVRLGMSTSVDITTNRVDNVLAVPESFLIDRDGKSYVKLITWLDAEHVTYQLDETEVEVGLKTDQYVEIKSGLKQGNEIAEPSFTVQRKGLFGF